MSRVYIAGPMTGYPAFNYPAFIEAAAALRAVGYDVVSPAEINPPQLGFDYSWAWYMRRDIAELIHVDAVATLTGWEDSRGASLECHIATELGIAVAPLSTYLGTGQVMGGIAIRVEDVPEPVATEHDDLNAEQHPGFAPAGVPNGVVAEHLDFEGAPV